LVLVGNCPRPAWPTLGIADSKRDPSEMEFYASLNLELARRFRDSDRVHVLDLDRLVGGALRNIPGTERMYFLAKVPWAESSMNSIAQEILRYVVAARGAMRKCLVVDLDNTLWGGVVGEDGAGGIAVGTGSATAEAYLSFQHEVRSLRERGVLLAICSKNNPDDVEELFAQRTDMPLRMSDFATAEIGWEDKATGVRRIAETLNIGIDSLVVVDDNPAERAIVASAVAGATVLELPRDPADLAGLLRQQVLFEKLRINSDDLVRVRTFAASQRRPRLEQHAGDLQRYLADLGTEIVVRRARDVDLVRVHELFNKTNQFNLTTRRYSVAEVQRFLQESRYTLGVVSARDAFGDLGTIGVYLVDEHLGTARIDSFLLSCRALGRGIETAVLNCIKSEFGARANSKLLAEFIPTGKNHPAQGFLLAQGFRLVSRTDSGVEHYEASGAGLEPLPCDHVKTLRE
jgi:FkbH-like protein